MDTQGFLLVVKVHAANIADRVGAGLLLQNLRGRFPRLCHLFTDAAYNGILPAWIETYLGWKTEMVPKVEKTSPQSTGGFQLQRHRWKIERTFGWLIRFRRLALWRELEQQAPSGKLYAQTAAQMIAVHRLREPEPLHAHL